jgi:hypothetical protein
VQISTLCRSFNKVGKDHKFIVKTVKEINNVPGELNKLFNCSKAEAVKRKIRSCFNKNMGL